MVLRRKFALFPALAAALALTGLGCVAPVSDESAGEEDVTEAAQAVSLLGTVHAENLRRALQPLAQGNEGSVTIERLDLDLDTASYSAAIRHRHRTCVHIPFDGEECVVAYDWTWHVSGTFGWVDTNPVRVCADSPVGELCVDFRGFDI